MKWAKWFVEKQVQYGFKTVVFPGDFFHYRDEVSVKTLQVASDINRLFKESDIERILFIPGNHDCYFKDNANVISASVLSEPFQMFSTTTEIDVDGKKVCMVPWGGNLPENKVDIIIGHFDTIGFMMTGHICEKGFKPSEIMDKCKLCITGHFHKKQHRQYGVDKHLYYIGNVFQMDFSDSGDEKGIYLVYDDLSMEFIPYENQVNHVIQKTSEELKTVKDNCILKINIDQKLTDAKQASMVEKIKQHFNPLQTTTEITYTQDLDFNINSADDSNKLYSPSELMRSYMDALPDVSDEQKVRVLEYVLGKVEEVKNENN
jgi:DNA repair exonuclease SbcCD nuclease subunit